MADRGMCSRRKAEELIKNGCVKLNGQIVRSVALLAELDAVIEIITSPETKSIVETNKPNIYKTKSVMEVEVGDIKLYALYKPTGYIVSESEDEGKDNIYKLVPKGLGRLIYIGRLDVNSEGLLLLTNSGSLARQMTLPKNKILRIYKVRAHGYFDDKKIKRMAKGVMIEGVSYKPASFELKKGESYKIGVSSNLWFEIGLTAGKNREIRKLFQHFNLEVNRLIRLSYGNINLGALQQGEMMQIEPHKVAKLVKFFATNNADKSASNYEVEKPLTPISKRAKNAAETEQFFAENDESEK